MTDTQTTLPSSRLLRIQEVADELGMTTRAIRYYEEVGILAPAARSEGAYRLYDEDDVQRLRFIKGMRDDAGFSLAEIAQLLEDEQARARNRAMLKSAPDPAERAAILDESIRRFDRQIATLRGKVARLEAMILEAESRRARRAERRAELDAELALGHEPRLPATIP